MILAFHITLSNIMHVLVLYQCDVSVCRFEIVTNQGPIKMKQVIFTDRTEHVTFTDRKEQVTFIDGT
jgi:hypothetical protein